MGLKEHIVFPEINYDQIDQMWGMDIIVCTTARTDDEARALLTEFQFPFTHAAERARERHHGQEKRRQPQRSMVKQARQAATPPSAPR